MEKNINWHQIIYEPNDLTVPCKRWGHKTVYIEDEIVLFGGFSDVTYLNDLWAYSIHTNKWREIKTIGQRPQGKSNFTMHFDNTTNQLLIFGGGGPNKRRFNKISLLNWQNKQWSQVMYDLNEESHIPWQRTYHSSEFKYPYLITFGGQGAANIDLDDLWIFNIQTKKWTQIKGSITKTTDNLSAKNINKIQGRKFHSTAIIENELFVISGCRMNYICISNIYSIDLKDIFSSKFQQIQNNNANIQFQQFKFEWKYQKINQKQIIFIEKWGHSSQSYNGKIYIFGGRNQQDYNDLLQYDPILNTVQKINPSSSYGKLPKSRRRHSSCMIGSSMLIFGGFNQDYFNDLQYISLFECRDTLNKEKYISQQGEEIIQLQQRMFWHFMQQLNKDKLEYDIQIFIESLKHKQPIIAKSISSALKKKSIYFSNCLLHNQSSNPQRNNIAISINSLGISALSFQIFNNFLIKDLIILPKDYKLKKLCELLICADYFQVKSLFDLIQNALIVKVIDQKDNIDDIFNIAANWNMQSLLKVCAQKKILNRTYFNTYSKIVCINYNAARLKQKYVQQMLMEIQFDQIQIGQHKRKIIKNQQWGKNIKEYNLVVEQKNLIGYVDSKKKRKRSFTEKLMESFNKLCGKNSEMNKWYGQELNLEQRYDNDDNGTQRTETIKINLF